MLSRDLLAICVLLALSSCIQCAIFRDPVPSRTTHHDHHHHHHHKTTSEKHSQNECDEVREVQLKVAIMGGSKVEDLTSVPYIAAVGQKHKGGIHWFCGGSLISNRIVLTAAHCILGKPDVVRLGEISLLANSSRQDVAIESTIVHPEYRSPQTYHDIALLRLVRTVEISRVVRPICLASQEAGRRVGETTYVMGWGAKTAGGIGQDNLRKVDVQIFSNSECSAVYRKSEAAEFNFPRGIIDQQLCAGSPKGGKDACQGDSGGPLVVKDSRHVLRLLGVVSAGVGCGIKDVPGVYVRVSSYESWIRRYI